MDYALLQKIYNIKSFVGYTDEEIKELRAGFESIPHTCLLYTSDAADEL